MAATLSGKIAVYGIDGAVAFTGMVKTANILKGFGFEQSQREARLEKGGHIIGGAADLVTRRISVTFVPYSSDGSPTLAEAKALVVIPPVLGDVTISDFSISIFDDTYTAVGTVTATPSESGYLEMTLTAETYLQSDGTYKAMSEIAAA